MSEKSTPTRGDYIRVQGNKQYLPVPNRVQWFRGDHPTWTLDTSVIELNWAEGYAVMRAEVRDDTDRLIASGTKTETRKGFGDFVEKAETGAVGRALARAGYGTEDALDLEGDRYADAPIEQPGQGESAHPSGGATPVRTRPAPVQYRREELAELMKEHSLDNDAVLAIADSVGIPADERPMSDTSMDRLIDAVIESGRPPEPSTAETAPSLDQILEASGGELVPPKPGTDEYKALPVQEKAAARAYHSKKPDEPSLTEQLAVTA